MEYEHAMEFLENTLHELSLKKWEMEEDYNGKLSEVMQLVRFKPTHEVFRLLQQSYVEARAHLNSQVVEGEKRLETIEEDLVLEQAQFSQMASAFINKDKGIVDKVKDAQVAQGVTSGVVVNSRKDEILKMFSEVQSTQQELNANLLKEIQQKVMEQN